MVKRVFPYTVAFCLYVLATAGWAQNPQAHTGPAIGLQMGIWKPSSLDDHPSQPFRQVKGADYAPGLYLITPDWKGIALRFTLFQWQQHQYNSTDERIKLRHLSAEIKQQIISQARISPFMTLGLSGIYANSHDSSGDQAVSEYQRAGYGINVGAGIDFILLQHWSVVTEYQYLYAKFENMVGKTDNYSGPHLSVKLQYDF